jgi:hypothetical protein
LGPVVFFSLHELLTPDTGRRLCGASIAREGALNVASDVRVVRVFVSSPIDVAAERGRVQAIAAKLNREYDGLVSFETVLWEEHFYKADKSFQPQITESVACDIVVSIFWTRIGTELPADFALMPNGRPYPSGTAYELLTALGASKSKGLPDVYVFRKTADAAMPTADAERRRQAQTQLDALEAFWSEWFKTEKGEFKARWRARPRPQANDLFCCSFRAHLRECGLHDLCHPGISIRE